MGRRAVTQIQPQISKVMAQGAILVNKSFSFSPEPSFFEGHLPLSTLYFPHTGPPLPVTISLLNHSPQPIPTSVTFPFSSFLLVKILLRFFMEFLLQMLPSSGSLNMGSFYKCEWFPALTSRFLTCIHFHDIILNSNITRSAQSLS